MVKLKIGRNIFDIDKNDLILDNGSIYQVITKETGSGWNASIPVMSKKLFNNLKKTGLIFTNEELKQMAYKKYRDEQMVFWKFDIERMQRLVY